MSQVIGLETPIPAILENRNGGVVVGIVAD